MSEENIIMEKKTTDSEFLYNYKRSPGAIIGTIIILLVVFLAIFGPFIVNQNPHDTGSLELSNAYKPPFWQEGGSMEFPLGTDAQGRDMLSAIVYGSRVSLIIGILGTIFASTLGTALGLIAGYFGGRIDGLIMRAADVLLSFPSMLVALFIMAILGSGVSKLIAVFTVLGSVSFIRTVRAEVLTVKKQEYVEAARVIGIPSYKIILKHILPNVMTTIIVLASMRVGNLILSEATLSFLGVGVPVTQPSLGLLVKNGFDVLLSGYWWITILPGLYIMLVVFGINIFGDFLRDELNPRLK
jgi:peptide/nickel transport system permease protein